MATTFKLRTLKATAPQMIYLVYRFGRNDKLVYSTRLKIAPKYWNVDKMRVRNVVEAGGKDAINELLNEMYRAAESFCIETKAKGRNVTKNALRDFLDIHTGKATAYTANTLHGFITAFIANAPHRINAATGKVISQSVIRYYISTWNHIKEYEHARRNGKELDFEDITLDFYTDFTAYLQHKKLSTNTIGKQIRILKIWLNEATEKGINTNTQYKSARFKVVSEKADTVYLTAAELEKIHAATLNSEKLQRVRDLFLIGAFTGLRFSDFTSITADNMHGDTLTIEQQKTGGRVSIPLHPIVKKIWKQHGEQLPKPISNQKFNDYIKEVCRLAGITDKTQKSITKGGLRAKQTFAKCDLISSHTARRSFATNLYLSGFPSISIMQMTGHKTEKAFMSYIRVTATEHANLLRTHWAEQGEFIKLAK